MAEAHRVQNLNGNRPYSKASQIPFRPWTRTPGPRPSYFAARYHPLETPGPAKREGMAPMQWPDASVSATGAMGFEAMSAGFDAFTMVPAQGVFTLPVPTGLDLPCTQDPEL